MDKRADLGQIVRYDGTLMEVIAIGEGRHVVMRPINAAPCPSCGSTGDVNLIESSRSFQEHVEPVATVNTKGNTNG